MFFKVQHKREKIFGEGRSRPLDRNLKARIFARGRALTRRTQAGRAYGRLTAKGLAVLGALLYGFHNAATGRCFPSLERIAEAAACAVSTVKRALADLEAAGVLSWVNRLVRLCRPGGAVQVVRTSNAYVFADPADGPKAGPDSPKADLRPGTKPQVDSLVRPSASRRVSGDRVAGSRPNLSLYQELAGSARLSDFKLGGFSATKSA